LCCGTERPTDKINNTERLAQKVGIGWHLVFHNQRMYFDCFDYFGEPRAAQELQLI
jgi:hypothetical protein